MLALAVLVALGAVAVGQEAAAYGPPEVGASAPDFTLAALDGESHALSERRGEGPVVLVFFRGVW